MILLSSSRDKVSGDIEIAKYFINKSADKSLIGGDLASEVDEILAMTINSYASHSIVDALLVPPSMPSTTE